MQDKKIEILEQNVVKLCCGGKCPKVRKTLNGYEITDDYNNTIYLDPGHFELLKEAVDYFHQN